MKFPTQGLYAITDTPNKTNQQIITEVEQAIKGGAVVIQYRDKNPSHKVVLSYALLKICQRYQVPFIINDDVELAKKINADGVHLGKEDGDIEYARTILGAEAIIGVSCYNDLNDALSAEKKGVDYVAFGRFFPSTSKPLAASAELTTLTEARKKITVPIVAIGGILPENGQSLLNAGADLLAVIGGVFQKDVEQSAQAYQVLFNP
ncbi:MAG: thiamine phosphate synthase [Methylococcales bacterium]|nr:thiamine phosphate synthase [Methylococcales bacterium]MCK5925295.1 thiamine phosphate synthase [Methylococcales bacterium]